MYRGYQISLNIPMQSSHPLLCAIWEKLKPLLDELDLHVDTNNGEPISKCFALRFRRGTFNIHKEIRLEAPSFEVNCLFEEHDRIVSKKKFNMSSPDSLQSICQHIVEYVDSDPGFAEGI